MTDGVARPPVYLFTTMSRVSFSIVFVFILTLFPVIVDAAALAARASGSSRCVTAVVQIVLRLSTPAVMLAAINALREITPHFYWHRTAMRVAHFSALIRLSMAKIPTISSAHTMTYGHILLSLKPISNYVVGDWCPHRRSRCRLLSCYRSLRVLF
jgi:hypothetical protein